jgi:hypothetical protein
MHANSRHKAGKAREHGTAEGRRCGGHKAQQDRVSLHARKQQGRNLSMAVYAGVVERCRQQASVTLDAATKQARHVDMTLLKACSVARAGVQQASIALHAHSQQGKAQEQDTAVRKW